MNICVAAICKNESKNVQAWLEHVSEADKICLVDTGSTDGTPILIEQHAPTDREVHIMYDIASGVRNLGSSRNLAATPFNPDDIVIWLDLDERFSEKNWVELLRSRLEKEEKLPDGLWIEMNNGGSRYKQLKGYQSGAYSWRYRAHEVLDRRDLNVPSHQIAITEFHTDHYPDMEKARDYLPELAADVRDYPRDSRASFYYARELCYAITYHKQTDALNEAVLEIARLSYMPNVWQDYVALANTELAIAAYACGQYDTSMNAAFKAVAARPDRIEPVAMAASVADYLENAPLALGMALRAIDLYNNDTSYLFDTAANNLDLSLDIAFRSCITLGLNDKAMYYGATLAQYRGEDPVAFLRQHNLILEPQEKADGQSETNAANSQQ